MRGLKTKKNEIFNAPLKLKQFAMEGFFSFAQNEKGYS